MGGERKHDGVRAASASSIEIDFYYAGQRCKERIKLQPTPANLRRAANHRASILDAIAKGVFDYAVTFPTSKNAVRFARVAGDVLTFAAYIDAWLDRKEAQIAASTWEDYRKAINGFWVPNFGPLKLTELTRPAIRDKVSKLECGNKRIGNLLSVGRTALAEALEDELIEANPLAGWTYRKAEPPKEDDDIDPFTREEQALILGELEGQAYNFVLLALWTGLRTSELVALNWSDVDWVRGTIRVRRATTQAAVRRAKARLDAQFAIEDTKTTSGRREVKILPPAMQALTSQKAYTQLKGEEVFQNPRTLERWTGDQPIRKTMWTHALKRAGVRYRNPYQTRHTYASMMLSAREHPMWVAQQMGHKDWGMIRKIYGRFMPDADPHAGDQAAEVFGTDLVSISRRANSGAG